MKLKLISRTSSDLENISMPSKDFNLFPARDNSAIALSARFGRLSADFSATDEEAPFLFMSLLLLLLATVLLAEKLDD